jgi:hypothetical protein
MLFFALPCLGLLLRVRALRRLALIGVPAAALIVATSAGTAARLATPEARELAAFNLARSLLVDIPSDPVPAALAAAGWSRGDYETAHGFGVYDEDIFSVPRIHAFLANAGGAGWLERRLRTVRTYLLGRFHLLCLAALLCVAWLGRAGGGAPNAAGAPPLGRVLVWLWLGGGTLALAATRFPPRAFVPLYLFLGALWLMAPPIAAVVPPRPRVPAALAAATVVVLLAAALAFWIRDARVGTARLAAESRELAVATAGLDADAIIVPAGPLLELQYSGALSATRPIPAAARMPRAAGSSRRRRSASSWRERAWQAGRPSCRRLPTTRESCSSCAAPGVSTPSGCSSAWPSATRRGGVCRLRRCRSRWARRA